MRSTSAKSMFGCSIMNESDKAPGNDSRAYKDN